MTISESLSSTIVTSIAPTLAGLATLITTILVGIRASKKSDQIHVLVNSNLTAVKADLALALERVEKLEKLLTTMGKKPPDKT